MTSKDDSQNKGTDNYCQAHAFARPEFNSSQSSQLFINCCFALSLSAMFWALTEASKDKWTYISWVPLTVYLIFVVWRQYSGYCIPLQFYRQGPESDMEELITLVVTFLLAAFSLVCLNWPRWSWTLLFAVLVFNLIKLKQMKVVLRSAPATVYAGAAIKALDVFRNRIWIYICLLLVLMVILFTYPDPIDDWTFSVIGGIVPLAVHFAAQAIHTNLFVSDQPDAPDTSVEGYLASVAAAWSCGVSD